MAHSPDGKVEGRVRPVLYDRPFVTICAIALLAYSSNHIIQPALPILVLERGGDAVMVGFIVALFSFPSVLIRPFIGRMVDTQGSQRSLAAGVGLASFAGVLYLVPSLLVIGVGRILHGAAWGAFNTGGHTTLATLAPVERRGEAASIYNVMPGIAQTVMPGIGILLLGAFGTRAPFAVSILLAAAATAIVLFGQRRPTATTTPAPVHTAGRLIERSALLPMLLEFSVTAVQALFVIYPPLIAAQYGLPLEGLAAYYPLFGISLLVSRVTTGRILDRVPTRTLIMAASILAIGSLLLAATARDVATLTAAGMAFAASSGLMSPSNMAMAISRARPGHLGSAMATYTLGFQLGIGVGAATWGVMSQFLGFPAPFLAAAVVQLTVLGLVSLIRSDGVQPASST